MKIGIDVDGVIFDFEKELKTRAELYDLLELRVKGMLNCDKFNLEERYGWNKVNAKRFIEKYFVQVSKSVNIMPGAKEVINLLKKDNHKLIIISSRGYDNVEMQIIAEERFEKENLKFDKYYWKILDKVKICKEEKIDLMIDDNYIICKELSDNLIKTLYLRDVKKEKLKENNYLKEVNSWGEIYRFVYNLNN